MSEQNVITFLTTVATRPDVLESLRFKSKDEVLAAAADFNLPFTNQDFDDLVWYLESHLAERLGEAFDNHFSLWESMWGQTYLEFLVRDMMTCFSKQDFQAALARNRGAYRS